MSRIIEVNNIKFIHILPALFFVIVAFNIHAGETDAAMAERNKALRQQHGRVHELIQKQGTVPTTTNGAANTLLLRSSSVGVAQSANGMGVIELSEKSAINQQLRQGMNKARASLHGIKAAKKNVAEQELQRSQANAALDQAVRAYLACRAEAKVPIYDNYEQDPFLREMIAVKHALTQKQLDEAAVNAILDRLAAARTILVSLTETRQ